MTMADTPHPPSGTPGGHGHGHGDNPLAQLWMAMSGASAGGHHEEVPGVDPKAALVGHEADQFNAKTIIYVPIAVAIALVVTYLIVQGAFAFVNGTAAQQKEQEVAKSDDPKEIERVREANKDRVKDPNERIAQQRTWTAEAPKPAYPGETTGGAKPQAGLEARQEKDYTRKDINGNTVKDPPFLRSFRPEGNNSPVIYPEDLRPANFVDPFTRTKLLDEPQWVEGQENKLAVVPIDEMIHLVAHDPKWKDVLKVAEKKATVHPGTLGKPKNSTGGVTAPLPPAADEKPKH
jgi:hypothetical protein